MTLEENFSALGNSQKFMIVLILMNLKLSDPPEEDIQGIRDRLLLHPFCLSKLGS